MNWIQNPGKSSRDSEQFCGRFDLVGASVRALWFRCSPFDLMGQNFPKNSLDFIAKSGAKPQLCWCFCGILEGWRALGSLLFKGLKMEMTYQERIDYTAKKNGLDLIVKEIKEYGYDAVIDQTGGFILCVGVYGVDGWIWANDECVCFYTNEEDDEGELLLMRGDEDTKKIWAIRCAVTFALHIKKVGKLNAELEKEESHALWIEINKNAEALANFYQLREDAEHRAGKSYTSYEFLTGLQRWNGWELSNISEFIEAINESAEMGRN